MTWRERIQAARERGGFTEEDRDLARACSTCAVGEVMGGREGHKRYVETALPGEEIFMVANHSPAGVAGWTVGVHHSASFTGAVMRGDIDESERLLDAIEDRALQVKRELQCH